MGTPAFAVPCLQALLEVADVPLVVTQPDRPQGRGMALAKPPVKVLAEARGLRVIQPEKARDGQLRDALLAESLDVAVVVAYGKILPPEVLAAPRLGCLNVHASLLPRYRGAAPIQWAIVRGETETGVCLMQMDAGMDTGPVLARRSLSIGPDETAGELFERLAPLGAQLLGDSLLPFARGELTQVPQCADDATSAPMIRKVDGALDFSQSAQSVHDRVRGLSPWPGAFTAHGGRRIKVHRTRVERDRGACGPPGSVISAGQDGVVVACGQGQVRLEELQAEGKKRMPAAQFLAGFPLPQGSVLASHAELSGKGA